MAFGNLTVDFRQLSKIPVRDRVTLAQSPQASSIFGNMSPTEIAALFPDYYKKFMPSGGGGASMASGMTGAGRTGTGTSTTSTATTSTTTSTMPKYMQDILSGVSGPQQTSGPVPKDTGMFNTIRKAEGTTDEQAQKNGFANGYDVVLGYGKYGRPSKPLTQMSFREVYDFQRSVLLKKHGSSTAVGAFQIVSINIFDRKTGDVTEFMKKAGLSMNDAMTPENQRKLAYQIYKKQGLGAWEGLTLNPQLMSIAQEQAKTLDIESDISGVSSGNLSGTAPQTGQAPQGSDVGIQNLTGTPADRSAAVVAAPSGASKTMLLSMGTNDWGNPEKTYQNTLDAINEGRRKGYNVVVVPPTGSLDRIKKAHDEVMRAVAETGASIEQPGAYSSDGYHPTSEEYKRIAQKYPASVVVGDSIAQGIGTYMDNAKVVATQGIQTDAILAKLRSEQVAQQETAQVSANFDASVFAQLDPRLKEWYDKASEADQIMLQAAIQQKGIASLNETMAKYPKTTATAAGTTALEEIGEITNVRYGDVGQRDAPVDAALQKKISAMITDIYGPEYEAVIYSGGESLTGAKVSKSGRHDVKFDANGNVIGGQAADVYIRNRETGEVVPRAQQIKAAQYWQAKEFGGIGLGMKGGGIHLDQVQRGEAKGADLTYRAWAYGEGGASQSNLTEAERSAMVQARSEEFDIGTITRSRQQALPGTAPQTQGAPTSETDVQPLQQANTNMALGGTKSLDVEPNMVNEKYTIAQTDPKTGQTKPIANFNKEEEVNIKDGQMNVESAYKKKSQETMQKTDTGTPKTNQYNMRQSTDRQNDELGRQIKDGIVPDSPSFRRSVYHSRFGVEHFNRGAKSQYS